MVSLRDTRVGRARRWLAWVTCAWLSGCSPAPPAETLDLDQLAASLRTAAPLARGARGIRVQLDDTRPQEPCSLLFELARVRRFELELEAEHPLLIGFGPYGGGPLRSSGKRWLPAGPSRLQVDFANNPDWSLDSRPALILRGSGRVLLTGARVERGPEDPEAYLAFADRALLTSSESLSHSTINSLRPPWWRATRATWLPDRIAWAVLALSMAVLAWPWARRRLRPGVVLALAVLLTLGAYDAYFALRILPAFGLRLEPDSEARIRENYALAPDVGRLAALARATLAPEERVGVLADPDDWFASEALCFNLAPRRCVFFRPGAELHLGLSGVERLRSEELDALVVHSGTAELPPGFTRIAGINRDSYIARRP